jgi:predicted DNA-binding protein
MLVGSVFAQWQHDVFAGGYSLEPACVRYAAEFAYLSRAPPAPIIMTDNRIKERRRAGRPPAGAKEGEKVKDYPQLSIRLPIELKTRLNALSAVTGLAQWRVIVEAINCFFQELPPTDRELVDGLSERLRQSDSL